MRDVVEVRGVPGAREAVCLAGLVERIGFEPLVLAPVRGRREMFCAVCRGGRRLFLRRLSREPYEAEWSLDPSLVGLSEKAASGAVEDMVSDPNMRTFRVRRHGEKQHPPVS